MSLNNEILLEEYQKGKFRASSVDIEGSGGYLIGDYGSLKEAVLAAQETENEYGLTFEFIKEEYGRRSGD